MLPTEILASAKREIYSYVLDSYVDNLKADGDFSLAGTEESMLRTAIEFYAAHGNPSKLVSVDVPDTEESFFEIDYPDDFSSVIQVKDKNLQSVSFSLDSTNSKISFDSGYTTPYELRYRYNLSAHFSYIVDVNGDVTVETDTDIPDLEIVTLIRRLLKANLTEYNSGILKMSGSMQMELPVSENQGEKALAEDAIKMNTRVQPSLMSI